MFLFIFTATERNVTEQNLFLYLIIVTLKSNILFILVTLFTNDKLGNKENVTLFMNLCYYIILYLYNHQFIFIYVKQLRCLLQIANI